MKNNIVMLVGKKQTGKDTIARFLRAYDYTRLAFADELKNLSHLIFTEYFDIEIDDIFSNEIKQDIIPFKENKNEVTYRQWLQRFGTEFFRNQISDTFWIDKLCNNIEGLYKYLKSKNEPSNFVIADVRFENEYRIIKERFENRFNIVLIKVERDTKIKDSHDSEADIDTFNNWDYNYLIKNDFPTVEDLYRYLDFELKLLL